YPGSTAAASGAAGSLGRQGQRPHTGCSRALVVRGSPYLMLTLTVLAATPSTVSTTSTSPRPAREVGTRRFTWSMPGYCDCTPQVAAAAVPPIVAVTLDLVPRMPVPYSSRSTGVAGVPTSNG